MQWALNQRVLAGSEMGKGVHRHLCLWPGTSPASPPTHIPSPVVPTGNLPEVLWVLRDGHVDDVQCMLVVFLGREEECQQVEGIGIILAHFQGLLQLLHGAGNLPEKTVNLVTFPKAQTFL